MGINGIGGYGGYGGYQPSTTALQSGPTASVQQVQDPNRQAEEDSRSRDAQAANNQQQPSPGQVTATRGNNLNIVV